MLVGATIGLLLAAVALPASDWPQWRGPNRDGVVDRVGGVEGVWPEALRRLWRVEIGAGQSSPVLLGQRAFLFSREGQREVAHALDIETGRLVWQTGYPAPYEVYPGAAAYGDGPRSTPIIAQGRLFTLGISGILTAFDIASGRLIWQKDFTGRYPASAPPFGTSMSPLMAGGNLLVHAGGHDGGALIAFDPATGREAWALVGEGPSYSSPIVATFLGQEQVVIQVHRKILGVDPATGRVLWSLPFETPCDQNIVTPLRAGNRLIVSSLDKGTMALELARSGEAWKAHVAWHTTDVSMYMSSPVLVNGRVLGLSHKKKGQFFALDPADGTVRWLSDGAQGENATFLVTRDSVLVLRGDGVLLVLRRDAESFAPIRQYKLADSATLAHPVLLEAALLIKDEEGVSLHAIEAAKGEHGGGEAPRGRVR